ncbi:hypothetical protein [Achromobacter mucicolens]|uniref:hypothetical protein n=1 Tax=Achromobacter mucicolens TaxID=1389922 RepID=UPI002FE1EA54
MAKFKKGDAVRRIKPNFGLAQVGSVYTVSDADGLSLSLEGHIAPSGRPYNYDADAFELVQLPPAPKEFRYRRVDGPAYSVSFATAEEAAEHIRKGGQADRAYEIFEVVVVQTVTPRRTLEVKQ